ncbi:MAG TPA: AMP-binding protein, partial [Aggregatilineales bacterium]|nr:AMP-binding protein [Aggregatilineales bacterium]
MLQESPNWLLQRGELTPTLTALVFGARRWTFHEMLLESDAVAQRLATLGISKGNRVAMLMRNGPDFVFLAHAMQAIHAVLVPLNLRLTPAEISWQLADVRAALLITDPANAANAIQATRDLPDVRLVVTGDEELSGITPLSRVLKAQPHTHQFFTRTDLSTIHSIIYTSGTTGKPKGVMLSYSNLWWSAMSSALNLGIHRDDVWLAVLPLFHVGGLSMLMRGAIYGCTVVVHEAFDPQAVNHAIEGEPISMISVVSTMLQR